MDSEAMIAQVREALKAIDVRDDQNVKLKGLLFEIKFSVHGQELAIVVHHGTTSIRLANRCCYPIKSTIDETIGKEVSKYDKKVASGVKNLPNADEIIKILDAAVIYFNKASKEKMAQSKATYNVISIKQQESCQLTTWRLAVFSSIAQNGWPIFSTIQVNQNKLTNQFRVSYGASDRKWKVPAQVLDIIVGAAPELIKAMSNPKFFEENVGDPTILG
jgi:hypothetical protein